MPRTRSKRKAALKKDKITPQKKCVYNNLSDSKNTLKKKSKSKVVDFSHKYLNPTEFMAS